MSDDEMKKAAQDAMIYGTGFALDGKHVPHKKAIATPPAPTTEEVEALAQRIENHISPMGMRNQEEWFLADAVGIMRALAADRDRLSGRVTVTPAAWQRRIKFPREAGAVSQWEQCSSSEATGHFERRPEYEYRPLFTAIDTAPTPSPEQDSLQARVKPWLLACFGEEIADDKLERGDRLLEEVFELLQSGGYPSDRIASLRDYVWSRETGAPHQEAGGVMITLAAYCLAHGLDMHAAAEDELARIWTKVEKIRAKQAAKPTGSALPIAIETTPSPDQIRKEADDLCVVWSNEHRAWWRANSAGYVNDVRGAGVYSRDEAMSISRCARDGWFDGRRPDEIPVRVADLPQWAREALITGGEG